MMVENPRFDVPLYTIAEAARIVGVPPSTLSTWTRGYVRKPAGRPDVTGAKIISFIEPVRAQLPSIPFVGLAEALVLAAVRKAGVSMQRIRPSLDRLEDEIGVEHALASRKLFTDGAELLFEYTEASGEGVDHPARDLTVVRSGQRVFVEIVQAYLRRIEYGPDGYAELIRVPGYGTAQVVADPDRSFGAPIFERGGTRVADVLQRFWTGESIDELVDEFGVPREQLEDAVRVASRRAA